MDELFNHMFAKEFLKANRELTEKALETTAQWSRCQLKIA